MGNNAYKRYIEINMRMYLPFQRWRFNYSISKYGTVLSQATPLLDSFYTFYFKKNNTTFISPKHLQYYSIMSVYFYMHCNWHHPRKVLDTHFSKKRWQNLQTQNVQKLSSYVCRQRNKRVFFPQRINHLFLQQDMWNYLYVIMYIP
jgi:hypothetical protein